MSVEDNFFAPASVTIAVGGTVTWTWAGGDVHDVEGKGFASPSLMTGSYSFTFNSPGQYPYICNWHDEMTGVVNVN